MATPPTFLMLLAFCILLSCLGLVELGLISSIVSYIHLQGPQVYHIKNSQYDFLLDRIPAHLHLDAGHVSNAAAGLGFFLGLLGIYIAFRERRHATQKAAFGTPSFIFITFVTFAVIEFLMAMAALIYSFVYDNQTAKNTITLATANREVGQHYTEHKWAPGTWFSAVLALPLASQSDRDVITSHVQVMKASKWMLVPIFTIAFSVMVVGFIGLQENRRARHRSDARWSQQSRGSKAPIMS